MPHEKASVILMKSGLFFFFFFDQGLPALFLPEILTLTALRDDHAKITFL